MRTRRLPVIVLVMLVLAMVLAAPATGAAPGGPQHDAPILLKAAVFSPGRGEAPPIPPGLTIAEYAQNQRGYYLVQFAGPIEQVWLDEVASHGVEILDYVPELAFKVRMNPGQARRVEQLASVNWVGLFHPAYKLSPSLAREGTNIYTIRVERVADAGLIAAEVARQGATILGREGQVLLVSADSAQLDAIAHVLDVAWVENFAFRERHNEYGAGIIMGANTANTNGFDGSSQTVAVADTGIGDGTANGAHADIPGSRVAAVYNWPGASNSCYNVTDDGAKDVDSGHGTHVAVSVLGDGYNSTNLGRGTAPAARLVFQAVENWANMKGLCAFSYPNGYYLIGIPSDLRNLFQQAYGAGARVHSNSWGSDVNGDYTLDSANTDDFIWKNRDMTITFSAGNSGKDTNNDGVVDNDSIGSPATAKNVITVGASENARNSYPCDTSLEYTSSDAYQSGMTCKSMEGENVLGTGSRWGFSTDPLKSDPTAGNAEQMAPFSSRGPTDDGRIKPDVVAPGTWVLSGYSSLYQEGYGDPTNPQNGLYQWDGWGMPYNEQYKYMGGTSMSNPLAAGAAAVIRDFYKKAHGIDVSAALVKATMINSAVDLLDENNDGVNDNRYQIPNVHEGWGRVNVANATDGSHTFIEEGTGLATGGSAVFSYDVSGGAPFKITLVWSDYPSTEAASKNLVNNLDLVVTAPDGTVYRGNVFSGGWSQKDGSADGANNVENVYIASPASGTWTVQITGANVPQGPQKFALVADGAGSASPPPPNTEPSVSIVEPAADATVSGTTPIRINASDTEDAAGTLTVEWNIDGGAWSVATYDTTTNTYNASWDTTTASNGGHTINARATDSGGLSASASVAVTVSNDAPPPPPPATTMHIGDLDGSSTNQQNRWTAIVTITVHDANHVAVSGVTVSGSWSNGASGTASCTTDTNGRCTVSVSGIQKNRSFVTFTVGNVTDPTGTLTYDSAANHDPDGDSNGTSLNVSKP